MSDDLKTRNFAPPERMMLLCNKAIDVIAMLVEGNYADHTNELYSWLHDEVGMTDDEIKTAGYDCVPSAASDIESCVVCGKEIDWDSADEKRGHRWPCEECCAYFCEECFKERHGQEALSAMLSATSSEDEHDIILCPDCYAKNC